MNGVLHILIKSWDGNGEAKERRKSILGGLTSLLGGIAIQFPFFLLVFFPCSIPLFWETVLFFIFTFLYFYFFQILILLHHLYTNNNENKENFIANRYSSKQSEIGFRAGNWEEVAASWNGKASLLYVNFVCVGSINIIWEAFQQQRVKPKGKKRRRRKEEMAPFKMQILGRFASNPQGLTEKYISLCYIWG